jgi:hypothetical protein
MNDEEGVNYFASLNIEARRSVDASMKAEAETAG